MIEVIGLITTVIGLIATVITVKQIKKRRANMDDNFSLLKYMLNVFGAFFTPFLFIIVLIVLISLVVFMMTSMFGEKDSDIIQIENIFLEDNMSNNHIAFESINLINSSVSKDNQLLILMKKALVSEEDGLVVNIIKSITSSNTTADAVDIIIEYYINNNKLYLLPNIIRLNPISTRREENIILLLEELYKKDEN